MAYTNSKEEKLSYFKKLSEYLNTGDESLGDELFADDFKLIVPGTGGRDAPGMPIPPGKEGDNFHYEDEANICRSEGID
jgi:hypothetical protein